MCLKRELYEEFGIETEIKEFVADRTYTYPELTIRVLAYRVKHLAGEVVVNDHVGVRWIAPAQFGEIDFAPADVAIIKIQARKPTSRSSK